MIITFASGKSYACTVLFLHPLSRRARFLGPPPLLHLLSHSYLLLLQSTADPPGTADHRIIFNNLHIFLQMQIIE